MVCYLPSLALRVMSPLPTLPSIVPPPPCGVQVPKVALSNAHLMAHVVAQRGIDTRRLLSDAKLSPALLAREHGELYAAEYAALVRSALRLTNDPCLGFELGMNMTPTMHGPLGYALISARSLSDALDLGVTYWRLTGRFIRVSLHKFDDDVRLRVNERMPLGSLQRFAVESTIAGWMPAFRHMLGETDVRMDVTLRFMAPYHPAFERYADRLPMAQFGCDANEIVIPAHYLDMTLPLGHPDAARQAKASCDVALARLTEQSSVVHQVAEALALTAEGYPTMAKVAEALTVTAEGYPTMAKVAQRMGVTSRTLARHLDRHGLTFRQVLDECRHQEARTLLADGAQAVEDIAARLGYNDPANFSRAFRRWSGCTPTQYRQKRRSNPR